MEEHAPTQERRTKVCAAVHLDSEAKVVNLQKVCTVSVRSYSYYTLYAQVFSILQKDEVSFYTSTFIIIYVFRSRWRMGRMG